MPVGPDESHRHDHATGAIRSGVHGAYGIRHHYDGDCLARLCAFRYRRHPAGSVATHRTDRHATGRCGPRRDFHAADCGRRGTVRILCMADVREHRRT